MYIIIFFFFVSLFSLLYINSINIYLLKLVSLVNSRLLLLLLESIFINKHTNFFGNIFNLNKKSWLLNPNLNFVYSIQFDAISIYSILLTILLTILTLLSCWTTIKHKLKTLLILLFLIQFILIFFFLSTNFLFFHIFFEAISIPMFFVIGLWGARQRKIYAVFPSFFYTFLGSMFMLFGLFIIYSQNKTFDFVILSNIYFPKEKQLLLWILLFIAFCIKVPMFPFHVWLPEAHVEAPTIGSVLLAGILLKSGTLGMYKTLSTLFPYATFYFSPFVYSMCTLGIVYISCIAIRQVDLKKIIAYASIAHTSYVILGLFSFMSTSILGSIFPMPSHGIVPGALLFRVGFPYDRYKTKLIKYYGGLIHSMPLFSVLFLIFILANMSFPFTSNSIGEFLILSGLFHNNFYMCLLSSFSIIFGAIYSIRSYNRIIFGKLPIHLSHFQDISKLEFSILGFLLVLLLCGGIVPNFFLNILELNILINLER